MRTVHMTLAMAEFLDQCHRTMTVKNRDYHPDDVAMLEILQTSWETGVRPEQDLWGRVRKQLSALRRFVIDGHVESEPPESRMVDVAVYMAMLHFWTTHKVEVVYDAIAFVRDHRPCECELIIDDDHPVCDRCQFLGWLLGLKRNLRSRDPQLPPIPKTPD